MTRKASSARGCHLLSKIPFCSLLKSEGVMFTFFLKARLNADLELKPTSKATSSTVKWFLELVNIFLASSTNFRLSITIFS
jgi:hypothetical protein